ncbi:hypothetical protein B5F07_03380 [Lachnoclostridium sp. An169]|uniref:FGGY-family carbohydrate kinase n=1 Tax=Lachnoclostridium sp. An169 TaxID=1965569 RepID=UPI000B3AA767|nr:FGGY-family carbohydrate kinase [Lachnoclostridium sp. An169]OUP85719.1 hypothetical protein B5F07_03380 [Lachnoclostridium sp. An169]
MNILILDVGTSSMRGILFSEEGRILHTVQKKYNILSVGEGRIEQDPLIFLNDMTLISAETASYAEENGISVDAVALTAQRSSVIPVDREGNALANAQMWQDKRTVPICEEMSVYNEEVFSKSGSRLNPVFSGTKMRWLKENEPDLYGKAWKLIVIPDYMVYHMTGNFFTDYTYGSRSLLMDLKSCTWDERLLGLFGVDREKLCDLKAPGSIMGGITEEFAAKTGLRAGIPVISCGGDQQCGMLGQGVTGEGKVSLTLGTGGFLLTTCNKVPENLSWDVICNASSDAGVYILEANMLTCTSAMEWFRNNFYREDADFYNTMNRTLQELPPGANGCMALPYFQGRSTPDWNSLATAAFVNLTLNTTREDMLKALLESICMEIRNNITNFEKYVPVSEILISGGLSKSRAFNQMQADVYGKTVRRSENAEGTALGAWMVAARTMGCYCTLDEAYRAACSGTDEERYTFRPEISEFYRGLQGEMNQLYREMWKS